MTMQLYLNTSASPKPSLEDDLLASLTRVYHAA